jgi:hypothetical protein
MPNDRPIWSADTPVSMPEPVPEDGLVAMYGFKMTQYRLAHDITEAEYSDLRVPIYGPKDPGLPEVRGDEGADRG